MIKDVSQLTEECFINCLLIRDAVKSIVGNWENDLQIFYMPLRARYASVVEVTLKEVGWVYARCRPGRVTKQRVGTLVTSVIEEHRVECQNQKIED